jgi:hypothetical protein
MTAASANRRFAVFAHFDPDGEVGPHVQRTVAALAAFVDRLVIVSTAPLTADARRWLRAAGELIERDNSGHDLASYGAGIAHLQDDPDEPGELILMNDSAVFPLMDLAHIFAVMDTREADAWGITPGFGYSPHIQSYMLVFRQPVLRAAVFRDVWAPRPGTRDRDDVIIEYEVGLARRLRAAGFRLDTYFRPSARDLVRGAVRSHFAELEQALRERRWRRTLGWVRRLPSRARRPEWNPAAALADIALRRPDRLPVVKISTVRDDPYRLGTPALLHAMEQRHPEHFAGVEAFLRRTDHAYGGRWLTTVGAPRARLRYRL